MSMKDKLTDVGLNSTKTENMRDSARGRERNQTEKNQFERNFCEICELSMPDVERFKHKNPTVNAEWICLGCADKNDILDEFRMTHQSDFAKQNKYKREFGATKEFTDSTSSKPEKKPHHQNSNQNQAQGQNQGQSQGQNRHQKNSNNKRYGKNKNSNSNSTNSPYRKGKPNNRHNNRPNNRHNNQQQSGNENHLGNAHATRGGAKYIIDENGDKNFNC